MMIGQTLNSTRLEQLRKCINDKDYMHTAIQRIAFVLSNELMSVSHSGGNNSERQRKKHR